MKTSIIQTSLFLICIQCIYTQDDKSHFQLHDKTVGELEISATKALAKISATADSVQMVIDPGLETTTKSSKRTSILKSRKSNMPKIRAKKSRKLAGKKSNIIEKLKTGVKKSTSFKHTTEKHWKVHDVTGSKKSIPDKEMRVHGQSGALHVHTDHNYTALNSESGKLEIYIKNPEHYIKHHEIAEHHPPDISVKIKTEVYKKDAQTFPPVERAVHIVKDVTGLKKSIVNTKRFIRAMKSAP